MFEQSLLNQSSLTYLDIQLSWYGRDETYTRLAIQHLHTLHTLKLEGCNGLVNDAFINMRQLNTVVIDTGN